MSSLSRPLLCFVWWIRKAYWSLCLIALIRMMIVELIRRILGILLLILIPKIRSILSLLIFIIRLIGLNLNKSRLSLISNSLGPIRIDYTFLSIQPINYNRLFEKIFLELKLGLICIRKLRKSSTKLRTIRKKRQD